MGFFSGESAYWPMPVLETPRLRLRKLTMRDAADIYAYSRDDEVARYVLWDAMRNIGEARAFLRYMLRRYRAGMPSSYGIELKETGRVIGTIGFMGTQNEHNSAEVGYSLAHEYWNCGLMTEALTRLLRYAFEELGLHRVEAQHELLNPASGRVLEKAGMRREGTLRGRLYNKGRYVDVALYAILRDDPRP